MKLLLTIVFIFFASFSSKSFPTNDRILNKDTIWIDTSIVIINNDILDVYKNYDGNEYIRYRGMTKITETVISKDSTYNGEFVDSFLLDDNIIYINY